MAKKRARKGAQASPDSGVAIDLQTILAMLSQPGRRTRPDPLDAAQELIYDAWEAADRKRRVALAKKALALSPLCADAYVILAQEVAADLDEVIDLCARGVAAGEKALGKACFRDDVGFFWGLLETRPYMRARQALAQALWEKGRHEEAVAHYQEMLRLNPGDNQGIRYLLLDCLLFLGRDDDAAALIENYDNDDTAAWIWSRALLAFRRKGDCTEARNSLSRACRANTHIAPLLLGNAKMPRRLPDYISFGSKDEAVAYVHGAALAWAAAPGALAWLRACQQ